MQRVGVVGAGLMGSEIALVFALAGHEVLLADRGAAQVAEAFERLGNVVAKGVSRSFYSRADVDAALQRISNAPIELFRDREYVTEAVFEDFAVQAQVLA